MKKILYHFLIAGIAASAFFACVDTHDTLPYVDPNTQYKQDQENSQILEEGTFISEKFSSSLGGCVSVSDNTTVNYIIDYSSAKVTGNINSAKNAATVYLVSPTVDLSSAESAYYTFEHIIAYETGDLLQDEQFLVSLDYNGDPAKATWTQLPVSAVLNTGKPASWSEFVSTAFNLPQEYLKSSVTFAFKYTSTTSCAATWEIKNFSVKTGTVTETVPYENPKVQETSPEEPLTVTEALTAATSATAKSYVTGYIVGFVDGQKLAEGAVFSAENCKVESNILIAASATEKDVKNCLPVQLPANTKHRTALNLSSNKDVLGKQVVLGGYIQSYFGVNGLKSLFYSALEGVVIDAPAESTGFDGNDNTTELTETINLSFKESGLDKFSIYNFAKAEDLGHVWTNSSQYGMVAKGSAAENKAWLISPRVDVSKCEKIEFTFNHAANNFPEAEGVDKKCAVYVSKDYAGGDPSKATWTKLDLEKWSSNWTWVENTFDLTEYKSDNVHIAFEYTSASQDGEKIGSFEIDNVYLGSTREAETPVKGYDGESTLKTAQIPFAYDFQTEKKLGDFLVYDVKRLDSKNKHIWTADTKYGAKAVAATEAESWFISPKFALETGKEYELKFTNSYLNAAKPGDVFKAYVLQNLADDVLTAEKEALTMEFGAAKESKETTLDISKYAGKTVVIAFQYTASEEEKGTFEIFKFSLNEIVKNEEPVSGLDETAGISDFSVYDVKKFASADEHIWKSSTEGITAKATKAAESWLISSKLTLSAGKQAKLTFTAFTDKAADDAKKVYKAYIFEDYNGGNPSEVTGTAIQLALAKGSNKANEIDLSNYAGKNISIAFQYTSSADDQGTFRIKDFKIEETEPEVPVKGFDGTSTITEVATADLPYNYNFKEQKQLGNFLVYDITHYKETEEHIWQGDTKYGAKAVSKKES
ncbi:MAG: choice-of-anchor J domain-containing protein, partial [Bacteroidales bacterium]|nr:choice-of-anchor J domain-containing protein [Bacteroidales bacterium]